MDDQNLTLWWADLLARLHARGMKLPWLVAYVALNGTAVLTRITDNGRGGLDEELLVEHVGPDTGIFDPVNILAIDATGEAVRALMPSLDENNMTFH